MIGIVPIAAFYSLCLRVVVLRLLGAAPASLCSGMVVWTKLLDPVHVLGVGSLQSDGFNAEGAIRPRKRLLGLAVSSHSRVS